MLGSLLGRHCVWLCYCEERCHCLRQGSCYCCDKNITITITLCDPDIGTSNSLVFISRSTRKVFRKDSK